MSTTNTITMSGKSEKTSKSIWNSVSRRIARASSSSSPSVPTQEPAPPPTYDEALNSPTQPPSPAVSQQAGSSAPNRQLTASAISTADDKYAFLSSFDTVFLIDDSGSMAGSIWHEVKDVLSAIVPVCTQHDPDGIDIYFLNSKTNECPDRSKGSAGTGFRGITSLRRVEEIFALVRPSFSTPTGIRLNDILEPYLAHYEERLKATNSKTCVRPLNIIVITDGCPSDDPESIIIQAARKLDRLEALPYQVGIQFFQVGSDPKAARALAELDDELSKNTKGGLRDIVDTSSFNSRSRGQKTLTAEGVLKVVLGSVNKRLDRMKLQK